jgi:hypothetical protein
MADFMYSAWFRDETLLPDDQDYEWVGMFIIEAESASAALAWGDELAKRHAVKSGEPFIRSYVEDPLDYSQCTNFDATPRIAVGDDTCDPLAQ